MAFSASAVAFLASSRVAFLLPRLIPPYQVNADAVLFLRRRFALRGIRQRSVFAESVFEKPVTGLGVSRCQILLHFLHDDERLDRDVLFLRLFQRVNVVWVGYCALAVAHSQHRTDNLRKQRLFVPLLRPRLAALASDGLRFFGRTLRHRDQVLGLWPARLTASLCQSVSPPVCLARKKPQGALHPLRLCVCGSDYFFLLPFDAVFFFAGAGFFLSG